MNYDTRTTHIDSSQGRLQFSPKYLSVQAIYLGIYHNRNKPANLESDLDKI
jgi:hypothetical protein